MNTCTTEQEYIDQIAEPARRVCARYGYLPSVLIAQSCLESGYGIPGYWDNPQISALVRYNNMVGIKSELLNKSWTDIGLSVWPGKSLEKETPEVYNGKSVIIKDSFRKYDSVEQSLADFLCFLTWASNDGPGGVPKYGRPVLDIKDPAALIKAVHERGYATGTTYAKNVMSIVKRHSLTTYDNLENAEPTTYYPAAGGGKVMSYNIIDITGRNKGQVPASRNGRRVEWIVLHYLGVPNADNPDLYGGGYGGHFNVTRSGSIFKAADPRTAVVWHCGGGIQGEGPGAHKYHRICTNFNSIGIECGVCADTTAKSLSGDSDLWHFTEATQQAAAWLTAHLMREYGIDIDHVIRHYDVTGKTCPNPYVKNNRRKTSWTWSEFKERVQAIYTGKDSGQAEQADRLLRKGDSGEDVKAMQEKLFAAGFGGSDKAKFCDGVFGKNTEAALVAAQKAAGIEADGIYGPKSRQVLGVLIKAKSDKSESEKSDSGKEYKVQAGSFEIRSNAEKRQAALAEAGFDSIIVEE